jgi:hypothetical protein
MKVAVCSRHLFGATSAECAVQAFAQAALDYLVKPVEQLAQLQGGAVRRSPPCLDPEGWSFVASSLVA